MMEFIRRLIHRKSPKVVRLCVVGNPTPELENALKTLPKSVRVLKSNDGFDYVSEEAGTIYFVLPEFEGAIFDSLRRDEHQILGYTAVIQISTRKGEFLCRRRPVYNMAMANVYICFAGFKKFDLNLLSSLVHHMGGRVSKETSTEVTHYVSNTTIGDIYNYAVSMRKPIMSEEWIRGSWEKRHEPGFSATEKEILSKYKLKCFFNARICFIGFPSDELGYMATVAEENGGIITRIDDNPDHILVGNNTEEAEELLERFYGADYAEKAAIQRARNVRRLNEIIADPKKIAVAVSR